LGKGFEIEAIEAEGFISGQRGTKGEAFEIVVLENLQGLVGSGELREGNGVDDLGYFRWGRWGGQSGPRADGRPVEVFGEEEGCELDGGQGEVGLFGEELEEGLPLGGGLGGEGEWVWGAGIF